MLQLVIGALYSGFMVTSFNIFHENVPKIAKFHTNIITVHQRHLLPLLLKILGRLYPAQNQKLGVMIIWPIYFSLVQHLGP